MHDAQYTAERQRHPDALATEVITLRKKCRRLEQELRARTTLQRCLPIDYALAIEFAWSIAHSAAVTEHETPGRSIPQSTEPPRNPEAMRLLRNEERALTIRAANLHTATSWAIDHPDPHRRSA